MSSRRILVRGPAVRAGIVGALVARRCAGPDCAVLVDAHAEPEGTMTMLLRPDWQRFHHEIGLGPETLGAARPAFVTQPGDDRPAIPFAPFGMARGGAEFHHHWLRANTISEQPPLTEFSPAIALERRTLSLLEAGQTAIDFGLTIPRDTYAEVLLRHASSLGAQPINGKADADLTIDCGTADQAGGWTGDTIAVGAFPQVPGLEFQGLYNAATRLLALGAGPESSEAERREFNWLSAEEMERMADIDEALTVPSLDAASRPSLRRKIDLFAACGRIAREDFEVFAAHEWLALFWGRGLRPARYDRLADATSEAQLLAWLGDLHVKSRALAGEEQAA